MDEIITNVILLIIAAAIVVPIVLFNIFAKRYCKSDEGRQLISIIQSNYGISESEYNAKFSSSKFKFKKAVRYSLKDKSLKKQYSLNSERGILYKLLNYGTNDKKEKSDFDNYQLGHNISVEQIHFINEKVELFESDEKINKILSNFSREKTASVEYVEFGAANFKLNLSAVAYCSHTENIKYANFMTQMFYNSGLLFNKTLVSKYINVWTDSESYKKLLSLYNMLIQQNVIIVEEKYNELVFLAFCYVYYLLVIKNAYYAYLNLKKQVGVDFDSKFEETVENLDRNLGTELTISTYVMYICQTYQKTISSCYKDCRAKVEKVVENLNQKERLNNLINGTNKIGYTINDVDVMSGEDFEKVVLSVLEKIGYKCELTKKTADQGIDIIATKGIYKIGVQCKRYSESVGNHAIMEAYAGAKFYKCSQAMVITNNYFSTNAKELAKENNVILWDRDELKKHL